MKLCLLFIGVFCSFIVLAQHGDPTFKDGYALKGKDTIRCKVALDTRHEDARSSVVLLISEDTLHFFPGGPITGYGIEENGVGYHYGVLKVDFLVGTRRIENTLYVKKLVAGIIDLFEYKYMLYSTKRVTINGEEKPGSTTTTKQTYSDIYIVKNNTTGSSLATPVIFESFRKKDIEPYINDNAVLLEKTEKRFTLKELIALLKEYNTWFIQKTH